MPTTPFQRLIAYWVYGGTSAGIVLLLFAPLIIQGWRLPASLTFLCLPLYMLHQFEEHDDDRFRRFVNIVVCKGRQGLSLADVFWINVVGVWCLLSLTLWLVLNLDPGWSALAAWLLVINAAAHIGQALALRRYNPGLVTALLLLLPLGLTLLVWGQASLVQFGLSALFAVVVHLGLLARLRYNLARQA